MHIIGFLIFGLVIGLIARALYPGRQHMGWLSTAVLGMIGSVVGGLIGHALFGGSSTADGSWRGLWFSWKLWRVCTIGRWICPPWPIILGNWFSRTG